VFGWYYTAGQNVDLQIILVFRKSIMTQIIFSVL
jgi:hypothetical protein